MLNIKTFSQLLWGKNPKATSLVIAKEDELRDDGLTMGTLYIGKQGTGKTTALARHLVDYFKRYPDRAMFVLDWSGSITDSILAILMDDKESLKRVIYDEWGNPNYVVPMPEFSLDYGGSHEDQVQRVVSNMEKMADNLVKGAPVLGGLAIREIAPHFFRLLTAMTNDEVDSSMTWQITEAKRLINEPALLRKVLAKYGSKIPETAKYLSREFLSPDIKANERELRTFALRSLLNITDIREVRAKLGYHKPAWTPKEAIERGKLVLIDAARLINQPQVKDYLFTQMHSLIMSELSRRRPGDPKDKRVSYVLDEVNSLFEIPGMAIDISKLSPQYRSRKVQLYIVLQSLSQVSKELRDHIWSIGNIVSFAISNVYEAQEIAEQLFEYEPSMEKPTTETTGRPVYENDKGQYLGLANWIQRLKKRECIIRRHKSESELDRNVYHVKQTKNSITLSEGNRNALYDLKEALLRERGVEIWKSLEIINRRHSEGSNSNNRPTLDL